MSIHPSLAISDKDKKQRSVLKRTERLRTMMDKGQWKDGDKVYGLPKIKSIRIKIKKEKVEKAETVTAEGAAPAATGAETKEQPTAAKTAAKPAAKSAEKK
ncbi:MAG: small basic protein [Candidatus Omnitrophota bacterium]